MTDQQECVHVWVKERFLGAATGDEVCARCNVERPRQR